MLLWADILSDKCLLVKIILQLLNGIITTILLDLVYLIEPNVCHLAGEGEPWRRVIIAIRMLTILRNQSYVFRANDPSLNLIIPRYLHVLTVGFESFEHFYAVTFH